MVESQALEFIKLVSSQLVKGKLLGCVHLWPPFVFVWLAGFSPPDSDVRQSLGLGRLKEVLQECIAEVPEGELKDKLVSNIDKYTQTFTR